MPKLTRQGPWHLRFFIIDTETGLLLYLTSNGVGNLVTVEPAGIVVPVKQIVSLDIISVYYRDIIDTVPTTVVCCARRGERGLLHNRTRSGFNMPPRFSAGRRQQQS
jgi:hypothetical protein